MFSSPTASATASVCVCQRERWQQQNSGFSAVSKPALCTFRCSDCAVQQRQQLTIRLVDFNVAALYNCTCSLFFSFNGSAVQQLQQQHQSSFNNNSNDDIVSFCDSYFFQLE
jgi:hypothetical protein